MGYSGEEKREYQRNWINQRRLTWLDAHGPCTVCGSTIDLELHHVQPKDSRLKHGMGNAIFSLPEGDREAELAKCIVVCHDCHVKITAKDFDFNKHGTTSMYNRGCRCEECIHANTIKRREYRARTGKR